MYLYIYMCIYLEVALEVMLQHSVHLPVPHRVKNRSNAELNVRSREVRNAGYWTPEKLAETENIWGRISEIRIFIFNCKLFSLQIGVLVGAEFCWDSLTNEPNGTGVFLEELIVTQLLTKLLSFMGRALNLVEDILST
jgi:hypothetical protein